jgi:glycosyltransferase involved in cell wall biosynthesis
MNIVFIHQNFPGQWKHLAAHYGSIPGNQVKFVTQRNEGSLQGVEKLVYKLHRKPSEQGHIYMRNMENAVLHGQGAARALLALKNRGFRPDIIVGHSGWGETLYVKDVFPDVPLLIYSEFFYNAVGADVGFDPELQQQGQFDDLLRTRTRNAPFLLSLVASDWALTPTRWQWQQHPELFRQRISVIHEGVDCHKVTPNPQARFALPGGQVLTRGDEVITYVARNLEPYRGFHIFMRTVPKILERRPNAHVLIVGGDGVSYGKHLPNGQTYKQKMLDEVSALPGYDPARVHFLGRLPYGQYLNVLQISSAHVYLTYPFVLSWSMLEAMACGCLVVGSRTAPVQEVIVDGENGLLTDFFSPEEIAARVDEALNHPDQMQAIRQAARRTVQERYELHSTCLPAQRRLIESLASGNSMLPAGSV